MIDYSVTWDEHIKVVQENGHLRGAIEAHRIITESDVSRGAEERIQDTILYRLADEVDEVKYETVGGRRFRADGTEVL